MSCLKLNNVTKVNNNFLVEVSFETLKNLIDWECIKLDLSADVPYVPLEDGDEIHLNISKLFIDYYNEEVKELNVSDKFIVMDGAIRLINFTRDYGNKYAGVKGSVMFNISCFNPSEMVEVLLNNR